jgi:diaminohydroxyphosphoribosylaminopyrimidine deaminase/5-amino-6-(5-phosphoribosylamino)uracil reductase
MVGAVVVAGSRIVGRGYHRRAGEPHAEILALRAAGAKARGATLYVTLEPCCHTDKRTPPCVPSVVASGVRRVVVAMRDPNPRVRGRGITRLRRAGLEVTTGCLEDRAQRLNEAYRHWIRTGRPFLILKAAMTMDGKIATAGGASKWITGEEARGDGHRLRSVVDAVMVGIETVLHDDPQLTARGTGTTGRQPLRIVLDSTLRIPASARILSALGGQLLIATTAHAPKDRIEDRRAQGATVLVLPAVGGQVSFRACVEELGRRGVTSVLLEGGGTVNASALQAGLVDRVILYMAPTLLGGQDARSVIAGRSPESLSDALPLRDLRITRVGNDLKIEATPAPSSAPRSSRTRSDTRRTPI